jgi:hypothetical protein
MQGNYHLILVLIFFAFSALSWLIGKLREQAAIKKARDENRRARDEELRTGRVAEAPSQTRGGELAELRELAAKRQEQLRQMREMQKRSAASTRHRPQETVVIGPSPIPLPGVPKPGTPTMRSPRTPGIPGIPGTPGTPGVPVTLRPQGRAAAPTRSPQPDRGVQDIRPGAQMPRQKGRTPVTRREDAQAEFIRPPFTVEPAAPRRLVADTKDAFSISDAEESRVKRPAPIGLAALLGTGGTRPTAAEMRRAIVLNEIFSKPVSDRGAA